MCYYDNVWDNHPDKIRPSFVNFIFYISIIALYKIIWAEEVLW